MLYIRVRPGLSFATKWIGLPCCILFTFVTCYPLQITLSQNYLLPITSVLAQNTLLKTACHFLLLLVGFDTLTYRKDYDRSPILVGHQKSCCGYGGVESIEALRLEGAPSSAALLTSFRFIDFEFSSKTDKKKQ